MQWLGFGRGFGFSLDPLIINAWTDEAREASIVARRASRMATEASHTLDPSNKTSSGGEYEAIIAMRKAGQGVNPNEIAKHHDIASRYHEEASNSRELTSLSPEATETKRLHLEAMRLHRIASAFHKDLGITDPVISKGVAMSREAHAAAQESGLKHRGPKSSNTALEKARKGDHDAASKIHRQLEKQIRSEKHGPRGDRVADMHAIAADYHEEHAG